MKMPRPQATLVATLAGLLMLLLAVPAAAAPEAHILRIDPRAAIDDGAPILTTVIELVQNKRLSEITKKCARLSGAAQFSCTSKELEKPRALWSPFDFPGENAFFTVTVDGTDIPTTFIDKKKWSEAKGEDGVGTAWLILIDAGGAMGTRLGEAQAVATAFVNKMGPNDIVDIMYFNDAGVVEDSGWVDKKQTATATIGKVNRSFGRSGRSRPLTQIIKNAATDGFKELGNAGQKVEVPMHQAMVVLSTGSSGTDTGSPALVAAQLAEYMTGGRFPKDNKTLPKAPVPIVSIWFPSRETEELFENAKQYMENLANTNIGGFFTIVQNGESSKAGRVVDVIRERFDNTYIIKWRVPCIAPAVGQTFKLVFKQTNPPVAGDNFIDVPVGIDPTTWPLDIDVEETEKYAKKNKLYPGGTTKIFGSFCWGSDEKRAKLYLLPKGQAAPESLKGRSVEDAKKFQQKLVSSNLVGNAIGSGDSYVEFELPDNAKFLDGKAKKLFARMVVYDTKAKRTSAITQGKVLELPATEKPVNYLLIGGITFGAVVLVLLLVVIIIGGRGRRRR